MKKKENNGNFGVENSNSLEVVNLIIAKHRNGAIGEINLGFKPSYQKFIDLMTEEDELRYSKGN